jgi:hypothetical protein
MKHGIGRLLGVTILSLIAIAGTSGTASAATWVFHSHYENYGDCEQAWRNMHSGTPVAGPHECRWDAATDRFFLWIYV